MEKEVQNGPFPAAPKKRPSSYDERTIHFGRSTVETFRPGHIRQHFLFGQNHHYPHSYTPSATLKCSYGLKHARTYTVVYTCRGCAKGRSGFQTRDESVFAGLSGKRRKRRANAMKSTPN
jgi:hypothetical protein